MKRYSAKSALLIPLAFGAITGGLSFLGTPPVGWEKIIDHIDHAVKIAGPDHVGLGSDFDGGTMPVGMEDVSKLPKITDALVRRGYSEQNIAKILGGNLLRVMREAEATRGR